MYIVSTSVLEISLHFEINCCAMLQGWFPRFSGYHFSRKKVQNFLDIQTFKRLAHVI
jgi:hypothetical protein